MATGYDGNGFAVGDRVELHPVCDQWARGARYGEVVAISGRVVTLKLDAATGKPFRTIEDNVRVVQA